MLKISITSSFVWHIKEEPHIKFWIAGNLYQEAEIKNACLNSDFAKIPTLLNKEYGGFACVFETGQYIFAATDQVESYKLYLHQKSNLIELSNNPEIWMTSDYADDFDEKQKNFLLMTGYCQGDQTLYRSIKRILPGQYLLIDKEKATITSHRYYTYEPDFSSKEDPKILEKKLGDVLDHAIERTIKKANGNTIWLALSAGYDSRVLLGKFLEHGYKKLQTYSYGTPGNMESRVARDLAASVNVPWRFVAPQNKQDHHDYWHGSGHSYLFFAGGLTTTPALTEFYALKQLKNAADVTPDDLFTNGQTGDFLTGGHLHFSLPVDHHQVTSFVFKKHFSLFQHNDAEHAKQNVSQFLKDWSSQYTLYKNADSNIDILSHYLAYEWQERQCRYVVNQQKAYDFLELNWSLPLWDRELMDFYKAVPIDLQQDQKLYLSYLQNWNYRNLFEHLRLTYNPWPRYGFLIRGLANLTHLFGGREAKQMMYKRLYYYTDYNYLYKLFGWKCYNAFFNELRNPVSLLALDYISRVKKRIGLDPASILEKRFAPFSKI